MFSKSPSWLKRYKSPALPPIKWEKEGGFFIPPEVKIPVAAGEALLVKKGERVLAGQPLGRDHQGVMTHATLSGSVSQIDDGFQIDGRRTKEVIIRQEGQQTMIPLEKPQLEGKEDFLRALADMGIGNFQSGPYQAVLVNGTEYEPCLVTAKEELASNWPSLLAGMAGVRKHLALQRAVVVLDESGPAFEAPAATTIRVPRSYPKGADAQLTELVFGKDMDPGKVLFLDLYELAAIGEFLVSGMPRLKRRLTAAGQALAHPQTLTVPIGTSAMDVAGFCGGLRERAVKIVFGGPLTGQAALSSGQPVTRDTDGMLFLTLDEARRREETPCIRCGVCIGICPAGLNPAVIDQQIRGWKKTGLEKYDASSCLFCGSCAFICPAGRHLSQSLQLAKNALAARDFSKTTKDPEGV